MKKVTKADLQVNPRTVGVENESKGSRYDNSVSLEEACCNDPTKTANSLCHCNTFDYCEYTETCIHTISNTPVCCDETQRGENCQDSVYVCPDITLAVDECTGSWDCGTPAESMDNEESCPCIALSEDGNCEETEGRTSCDCAIWETTDC